MYDFRLKVFHVVAQRLNFTRAAEELFISQPAVSKHIREIEAHYGTRLFERNGTRIKLTGAGHVLFSHVEKLAEIYRNMDMDIAALSDSSKGLLRIGASTTVAQYYLPGHIASFRERFPGIDISMVSNNTEAIEHLLIENKLDLAIVEGQSKRQHLQYNDIAKDEIVFCTRTGNPHMQQAVIKPNDLKKLPVILREAGSGSLEVIAAALKTKGINLSDLSKEIELQSTESIKTYLLHSNTFAFFSIHAILRELKENDLKIIDIKGLDIERFFSLAVNQGDMHSLPALFLRHLSS